jgi:hypothetical protein
MADVPEEAVTAALHSLHDTGCQCGGAYHPPPVSDLARLNIALTAAAPHIAAAQRERLAAVIAPERFRKLADWLDDDDARKASLWRNHLWVWPSERANWQDELRRFADVLDGDGNG